MLNDSSKDRVYLSTYTSQNEVFSSQKNEFKLHRIFPPGLTVDKWFIVFELCFVSGGGLGGGPRSIMQS